MAVPFSNEIHLNNFIDKDFQDMLLSLDIVMSVIQIPSYSCSDGFITPSNRQQKLKILMMNLFLLISIYFRFRSLTGADLSPDDNNIIAQYFDAFYYSLSVSIICIGNIINTYNKVNIVLILQKAFRMIRYVENDIKRLTFWNWMSLAMFIVGYTVLMGLFFSIDIVRLLLNFLPFVLFDASIMYIIRLLWIIKDGLRMWIKELKRGIVLSGGPGVQKMLDSYCLILDAFALFRKVSCVSIAFLIADITYHAMTFLQVNIDLKKQYEESLAQYIVKPEFIALMIWMSKHYLLLCLLCYALDTFYLHVREAQEICSSTLTMGIPDEVLVPGIKNRQPSLSIAVFVQSTVRSAFKSARLPSQHRYPGRLTVPDYALQSAKSSPIRTRCPSLSSKDFVDVRQWCKNIQRYTNARFRHLHVCGVRVDTRLPLRVAGVLATYTIVVLQFNL